MPGANVERWVLRIAGILGLAIFSTFFVFTFAVPLWVEDFASDYLEAQAIEQFDARVDAARPPHGSTFLPRIAAGLYERNEHEILRLKSAIKTRARALMFTSLAAARDPDCECRRRIAMALNEFQVVRMAQMLADNRQISASIQQSYLGVVTDLKQEIRIFTATNAASFLVLLLVSLAKPQAVRHLMFPGVLLLASTLCCAWLYLFSQN
ncbi:MAG: hypothetical protein ABI769_14870 [Pseudomonadota bacterium]